MTQALSLATPVIGLRPEFDGLVGEGDAARFKVIALAPDTTPTPMKLHWTLNRLERSYQWYESGGTWDWDVTTTRKPVASGDITSGAEPVALEAAVDWGEYEMLVERTDGDYVATSYAFSAGWYVPAGADSPIRWKCRSMRKPMRRATPPSCGWSRAMRARRWWR